MVTTGDVVYVTVVVGMMSSWVVVEQFWGKAYPSPATTRRLARKRMVVEFASIVRSRVTEMRCAAM